MGERPCPHQRKQCNSIPDAFLQVELDSVAIIVYPHRIDVKLNRIHKPDGGHPKNFDRIGLQQDAVNSGWRMRTVCRRSIMLELGFKHARTASDTWNRQLCVWTRGRICATEQRPDLDPPSGRRLRP